MMEQRPRRQHKIREVYTPPEVLRDRSGKREGSDQDPPPSTNDTTTTTKQQSEAAPQEPQEPQQPRQRGRQPSASTPLYKQLETRIVGQVKKLRYHQTFVEAYECEGWRRASLEKLKPRHELAKAQRKILTIKQAIGNGLMELRALNANDPQLVVKDHEHQEDDDYDDDDDDVPYEHIVCSHCHSTEATEDNDILLCDSPGCHRAYHQQCQVPVVHEIPEGDAEWFCQVCEAVFTCLKRLNYAFGTTYECIDDVFPELPEEEAWLKQQEALLANDSIGKEEEESEEEEDEDFEPTDNKAHDTDGSDRSDVSSEDEMPTDEEELKHLSSKDVIDPTKRSLRSRFQATRSPSKFVGEKAAREHDGTLVFGIVVEAMDENQYRVVYYDGHSEMLDAEATEQVVRRAKERGQEEEAEEEEDQVDARLVVHGKRKRTPVDYRALNAMLFANQHDEDEDDEDHQEEDEEGHSGQEEEDEEEEEEKEEMKRKRQKPVTENPDTPVVQNNSTNEQAQDDRRSRRPRHRVDYRLLHEGVEEE